MKKIKNILMIGATTIGLCTACVEDVKFGSDFLDKAPGVDVNIDSIFQKAEYARDFLWNAYSNLYYAFPTYWNGSAGKMNMGVFETLSDCWNSYTDWTGCARYYYSGTYSSTLAADNDHVRFDFDGEEVWECVRKCWIFIENIDRVTDMQQSEKERLIAEAKIMIASRYFDAFRHLGGLPIIDHAYTAAENTEVGRGTIEQTVNFMIGLLDDAIATASLPWVLPADEVTNWDGRMTKAAAYGLKCKIMCFAASPLFNDTEPYCTEAPQDAVTNHQVWWGGYKAELWTDTKKFCEDFFKANNDNGAPYHLVEAAGSTVSAYRMAYRNAYKTRGAGHANPEMIIQTRRDYYNSSNDEGWGYYFPVGQRYGMYNPTLNFIDMFAMADGAPFSYDWENLPEGVDPFADRDPRLYENVMVNGEGTRDGIDYLGRGVELWIGGRDQRSTVDRFRSGCAIYKYTCDWNNYSDFGNRMADWPYLRMAEIYLIYAEALAETGDLPGAIRQVNIVRARVGLKGLKEANPSGNWGDKEFVISEILRERACELGFEDTRLFDMIRRKRESDFRKTLYILKVYRLDENGNRLERPYSGTEGVGDAYPTRFEYERTALTSRYWKDNWSPKWYLEAMPVIEVNKGYGLTQNPGW